MRDVIDKPCLFCGKDIGGRKKNEREQYYATKRFCSNRCASSARRVREVQYRCYDGVTVEMKVPLAGSSDFVLCFIDKDDLEAVQLFGGRFQWWARKACKTFYVQANVGRKCVYLHRFILGESPLQADHIDRDGLNNRRSNLRYVTASVNQMNRSEQRNKSGFRWVHKNPTSGKWHAIVSRKYVGTFDSPEKAHLAAKSYAASIGGCQ